MQAFLGDKNEGLSLAGFTVAHYDAEPFNPPVGADLIAWVGDNFPYLPGEIPSEPNIKIDGLPAVRVYIPGSPRSNAYEEIYFMWNEVLINIRLQDVDVGANRDFYERILSSFQFAGGY